MGSVVLSLDAELAWGFHDRERMPADRVATARESWLRLLELFDDYDVPATWAVVGHLLLDSCDGDHADHPVADDWFERDPGTWEGRDEQWYGSKLVDAIENADADHEVGCHTFSHVEMRSVSREVASAEMRECVERSEERGLSVDSVVFPRNYVGHRDVLAAYGVKCYRGTQPRRWYDRGVLGSAAKLLGWPSKAVSPTLVTPEEDEYGLVNVPASLYLFCFEGRARAAAERVGDDPIVSMAKRGIDRASTEDGVFHMWLHPNNLTEERDFERMEAILEHLAAVRETTPLSVETMDSVAADIKDDEPLPREPIGPR
ncbi:polysaccharide deacetylase family protein [Halorussus sp. MSC15.2]|uniref:polysaccharide deacetylase family protein n=1 Tax=Halorussus sp. MSC15.2 TaxID=2283638 RepID=UPI0013D595C4|nr:polysaccharide deacetylase family protein [Halorussus sp. MSC15.2]NEU56488.1 polysaccharide deacetylase family protein [Halorussus sp. MSC15.2]